MQLSEVQAAIEAELNSYGYRQPKTMRDHVDENRLILVRLKSGLEVVAVPLEAV